MEKVRSAILTFAFVCIISLFYYFTPSANIFIKLAFQSALLFLLPLLIAHYFKLRKNELGLSIGMPRHIVLYSLLLILIAVPGMLYAHMLPVFNAFYPKFEATTFSAFMGFELLVIPAFFFLEFFYRGFALFQLKRFVGNWAILLQGIPYFLIHIGKPVPELFYSFFAGLVFAYVCLKAKSFLPAFAGHYTSAVVFDYLNW